MAIVGGFDIHRRQVTFDYLDTVTGQVRRGRIEPAGRQVLRAGLGRVPGGGGGTFAVGGWPGGAVGVGGRGRGGGSGGGGGRGGAAGVRGGGRWGAALVGTFRGQPRRFPPSAEAVRHGGVVVPVRSGDNKRPPGPLPPRGPPILRFSSALAVSGGTRVAVGLRCW